jgi:hypothetical protein
MPAIFDHAEAVPCAREEADMEFIEVRSKMHLDELASIPSQKNRLLIVADRSWVTHKLDEKTFIACEYQFKQGFTFGVCFYRDQQFITNLESVYCFHCISNLLNATAMAILNSEANEHLEERFMGQHRHK